MRPDGQGEGEAEVSREDELVRDLTRETLARLHVAWLLGDLEMAKAVHDDCDRKVRALYRQATSKRH